MAYTKLFNSIITSTIWSEDDKTRIVWITMLAIADKNGEVQGSIPGLARIAGVDVEDCRAAIRKFLSPDPDSRTKDDEGRRIEEIDGGWSLLNHQKYREMASKDELRESESKRKARYREKQKRNQKSQDVPDMSQDVPKTSHIAESEAEAEAEADKPKPKPKEAVILPFPSLEFSEAWKRWESHRKEKRKPITPTSRAQQLKKLGQMSERAAIEMIDYTIFKGWEGLREPEESKPRRGTIEANNPEPVNYGTPGFTPARYP
jgi:hypothetical protein